MHSESTREKTEVLYGDLKHKLDRVSEDCRNKAQEVDLLILTIREFIAEHVLPPFTEDEAGSLKRISDPSDVLKIISGYIKRILPSPHPDAQHQGKHVCKKAKQLPQAWELGLQENISIEIIVDNTDPELWQRPFLLKIPGIINHQSFPSAAHLYAFAIGISSPLKEAVLEVLLEIAPELARDCRLPKVQLTYVDNRATSAFEV